MQTVAFDMDLPDGIVVDQAVCIVTYLDDNGDMRYGFHIGQTTSVITLVGMLEVVKHHALVSKRIGHNE